MAASFSYNGYNGYTTYTDPRHNDQTKIVVGSRNLYHRGRLIGRWSIEITQWRSGNTTVWTVDGEGRDCASFAQALRYAQTVFGDSSWRPVWSAV